MATEKLTAVIDSDTAGLLRGLQRAQLEVAAAGGKIGMLGGKFDKFSAKAARSMKRVKNAVGVMAAAAAAGFAVRGAAGLIKNSAAAADEIGKMSKRTGLSVEELQRMDFAARLSGSSLEDVERATRRMSGTIIDAQRGMKTAKDAFAALGLTTDNFDGKRPADQLNTLLSALAQVTDKTKQAALAEDIFGRAGTRLLPMLEGGAEAFRALLEERNKLGPLLTPEQIASAERFNDAMLKIKESFATVVTGELAKSFDDLAGKIEGILEDGTLQQIGQGLGEIVTTMAALTTEKGNLEALASVLKFAADLTINLARGFLAAQKGIESLTGKLAESKLGRMIIGADAPRGETQGEFFARANQEVTEKTNQILEAFLELFNKRTIALEGQ
jgi:hypothetical protein